MVIFICEAVFRNGTSCQFVTHKIDSVEKFELSEEEFWPLRIGRFMEKSVLLYYPSSRFLFFYGQWTVENLNARFLMFSFAIRVTARPEMASTRPRWEDFNKLTTFTQFSRPKDNETRLETGRLRSWGVQITFFLGFRL